MKEPVTLLMDNGTVHRDKQIISLKLQCWSKPRESFQRFLPQKTSKWSIRSLEVGERLIGQAR